ncbi:hypothetical protein RND81_09G256400 [Saponaria officinalis]|uniref:Tf2-1-like SH3-like domain-containing protein n=1 Tax=Saponaria officinalis TaxID=3572 RepID=A0AAW1IS15_SAPOF
MDFIEGLPKSQGKDTILVVVDRLSKYAHFLLLSHPFDAKTVAKVYFDQVFKLHGWWYNSNFHTSIGTTPFEVVFGQPPHLHVPYISSDSSVAAVDRSLKAREECISMLKFHLQRAQSRMKSQSDQRITEVQFSIGDLVYVKLQPYRQHSVVYRSCNKLVPRYFGPFEIVAKIGEVAYKLNLPDHAKVHPVFHVSQLKKHYGPTPMVATLPALDGNLQLRAEPVAVLERKMSKKGRGYEVYLLVHWSNGTKEDATWELFDDFVKRFPDFKLNET